MKILAKLVKVVILREKGGFALESSINYWMENNTDKEIVQMDYGVFESEFYCAILYKDYIFA